MFLFRIIFDDSDWYGLRRYCRFNVVLQIQRGGDFRFETISFETDDWPKPGDLLKTRAISFCTHSCIDKIFV